MSRSEDDLNQWEIVRAFFDNYGLVQQQIESYNVGFVAALPRAIAATSIEPRKHTTAKGQTAVKTTWSVTFSDVYILGPSRAESTGSMIRLLTPFICKERQITYDSEVHATVTATVDHEGTVTTASDKKMLFRVPIMVKSSLCTLMTECRNDPEVLIKENECPNDMGGYFIVRGSLKCIVPLEHSCFNTVYVFQEHKHVSKCWLFSEIRSLCPGATNHTLSQVRIDNSNLISVALPYLPDTAIIPLPVVFWALGILSVRDMVCLICMGDDEEIREELLPTFEHAYNCQSRDAALDFIGRANRKLAASGYSKSTIKGESYVVEMQEDDAQEDKEDKAEETIPQDDGKELRNTATRLLTDEFLPHMGHDLLAKAFFLGFMTRRLLDVALGRSPLEDRDHYANKRIGSTGPTLLDQVMSSFRKMRTDVRTNADKITNKGTKATSSLTPAALIGFIKSNSPTNAIMTAMATGKWGKRTGVSQAYETFNRLGAITNARRISTPMPTNKGSKVVDARNLHGSHLGKICPAETPEGAKCGLVKCLAMTCVVTTGVDPASVTEIVLATGALLTFVDVFADRTDGRLSMEMLQNLAKVMVNGKWIGLTRKPSKIVKTLRNLRRSADLNPETSIVYARGKKQVRIWTDAGRLTRPVLIVEDGRLSSESSSLFLSRDSTWTDLLSNGIVELVDQEEEEECIISESLDKLLSCDDEDRCKFTHCEIDPSLILGAGASVVQFPNHNPAPRNTYQSAMGKQAIGVPFLNFLWNSATFFMLHYPQKPLVTTRASVLMGLDEMPPGQNMTVAVLPRNGDGQEDSVILNDASVQRAMGACSKFLSFSAEIKANEMLAVPTKELCGPFKGNPRFLDEMGIIESGVEVEAGDILIGRLVKNEARSSKGYQWINWSVLYDGPFPGVVHSVVVTKSAGDYEYVRVTVAQSRPPELGDKFATRYGQKGVCGARVPIEDMPFTSEGIVPDIIINPAAFPSRMTLGQFIECLLGKTVSASAKWMDSFPFKDIGSLPEHDEAPSAGLSFQDVYFAFSEMLRKEREDLSEEELYSRLVRWWQRVCVYSDDPSWFEAGKDRIDANRLKKAYSHFVASWDRIPLFSEWSSRTNMTWDERPLFRSAFDKWWRLHPSERSSENYGAFAAEHSFSEFVETDHPQDIEGGLFPSRPPPPKDDPFAASHPSGPSRISRVMGDGTAFQTGFSLDAIRLELHSLGYQCNSEERMWDGATGEMLKSLTFFGPVYYQRLKHMAVDKENSRIRGGRTAIAHQPTEGRRDGGGLRIGLMEGICLDGLGSSYALNDRLYKQSDPHTISVCDVCGIRALEKKGSRVECTVCHKTKTSRINLPYGSKLVYEEMLGMGILMRFITSPFSVEETKGDSKRRKSPDSSAEQDAEKTVVKRRKSAKTVLFAKDKTSAIDQFLKVVKVSSTSQ